MTLAQMAREIERRRQGTLPRWLHGFYHDSIDLDLDLRLIGSSPNPISVAAPGLAESIMRDAMVMAIEPARIRLRDGGPGWEGWHDDTGDGIEVLDSDYGDDPTSSLFAAFCAVFPEPKEDA